MFVPFFTVDNELTAISKMKILFLVKKLKNIDFFLFLFFIVPVFANLIRFIVFAGRNDVVCLFFSVIETFSNNFFSNDTSKYIARGIQFSIVLFVLFLRFLNSRVLYLKMKEFENNNKNFRWSRKSKFWIMIFVPGITFYIYRLLLDLTKFEALHKYNL